jgi:hypothetical protein
MRIINKEVFALIQKVGNYFSIDEIEKIKDINVEAYQVLLKKYDLNYDYFIEKNKMDSIMKKYYNHQEKMRFKLGESILAFYNLHDCILESVYTDNKSLIFNIDSSNGYSDIKKICFVDYFESSVNESNSSLVILYVEVYYEHDKYIFQFLALDEKKNILELQVICKNILMTKMRKT